MAHGQNPENEYPIWPDAVSENYYWLHKELNSFQFYDRNVLQPLFQKLQQTDHTKVTILHIGDSHVQADVFTGEIRSLMQSCYGDAGRGMVFPYSTGRTHTAIDYFSFHTGRWVYQKNVELTPSNPYLALPIGVSGITSKTYDANASFRIKFKNPVNSEYKRVRILCKRSSETFDFVLKTPSEELFVDTYDEESADTSNHYIDVILKKGSEDLIVQMKKTDTGQNYFEIYGLSIETETSIGVLFHSVGINGAGLNSLLKEDLLTEQLSVLRPDAVVLDLGANDFWQRGMDRPAFESNLLMVVEKIRQYNPQVSIILSCSQDIYRGGYSIPDTRTFSDLIKEFSRTHHTAFYDWYWIAGGRYSMLKWNSSLLSRNDLIHLSATGYQLKGNLFFEAYKNTYNWYLEQDTAHSLVFNIDSLLFPPIDTSVKIAPTTTAYQWYYHKVIRNQTIWSVANFYGVSAVQIRSWNNLRSNYLWIGQILKIYAPVKAANNMAPGQQSNPPVTQPRVNKPPAPPKDKAAAPAYHKVTKGETLFSISRRYGTSTSAIMRLNGLKNYNIRTGQVLRVK